MGFRLRKSIKAGPFRMTVSKSGIGYSVGTKDARITKPAKGKTRATISAPGTGLSYSKTLSSKKKKTPAKRTKPKASSTIAESHKKKESCVNQNSASIEKSWGLAVGMSLVGFFFVTIATFILLFVIDVIVGLFHFDVATGTFAIFILIFVPVFLGVTSAVIAFRYYKPEHETTTEPENAAEQHDDAAPEQIVKPGKALEPEIASTQTAAKTPAPPEQKTEVKVYQVAGVSHYLDTLLGMAEPNELYSFKKDELIAMFHFDETIYKQTVNAEYLNLVHEPDNPYAPNAIKILLDGKLVGYVAEKDCQHILDIMDNDLFVSWRKVQESK